MNQSIETSISNVDGGGAKDIDERSITSKQAERLEIEKATRKFLAKGGEIKKSNFGETSGQVLTPMGRAMANSRIGSKNRGKNQTT